MIKAVVTGHSKGLGQGIAKSLLQKGHAVLGLSRTHNESLQEHFPSLLTQVPVDLADGAALQSWLASGALENFVADATLLLLINNAGLVTPIGPVNTQSPVEIVRSVQLNITVPMLLSAQTAQLLKPHQQLRVLHVSSGAGRSAYPGWSVYCASKAALDMHAQAARQDNLAQLKICSLAPGVIDTGMQAQIRQTDEALFPNKKRFEQLKNTRSLDDPIVAGERVVNYLLNPDFGNVAVDDLRSQ